MPALEFGHLNDNCCSRRLKTCDGGRNRSATRSPIQLVDSVDQVGQPMPDRTGEGVFIPLLCQPATHRVVGDGADELPTSQAKDLRLHWSSADALSRLNQGI